ncbi:YfhO family protein [Jeotgalibacillus campisalis]|uniref:YfhO family protein n=1 Tax=Jeotgalibacillus campisalis TaxID=220754 RepID=A0A0C2RMW3_9BACL|nr:YfhO family protein [Jeotgalibacillus campisalis]KIL43104.1 hypothetical protein KR50_35070 [Jeotgalibacillus campisalis]
MITKKQLLFLILAAFGAAFFSHFFFLKEWWHDSYMIGPNDGLNQIAPFKELFYNEWTSGSFFYSFSFGMGAGIYSQLGYYYSTNLFYILTVAVVYVLELTRIIDSPDVLFWAQASVWLSVIRVTGIIVVTSLVFRYMKINLIPAFAGATIYAVNVIYFRHVAYWEFFADTFFWIPLLVLGVEKIIREKKPVWFIAAVSLTVFTNFYFAYINLIFIAIYIVFRWFIRLEKKEAPIRSQLKQLILGGLLGFGVGSVGFVPAVYGYLNNQRPPFENDIPLFYETIENVLFSSLSLLLPAIFVLLIWMWSFYRNRLFLLFASISFVLIVLHFSPLAGSLFNGFSAPRNRFEYLAFFTIGGMTAVGLQLLGSAKKNQLVIAAVLGVAVYYHFYTSVDGRFMEDTNKALVILVHAAILLLAFLLYGWTKKPIYGYALIAVLIIGNLVVMNNHQRIVLYENGGLERANRDYLLSEDYKHAEQEALIKELQAQDQTVMPRLDWRGEDLRNNIPLIQGFYGTSAYSSIHNKHILLFYYEDMEIDIEHESVSRYSGFGDRANLYSLLRGKYLMHAKANEEEIIPYGFEEVLQSDNYIIYENTNVLPFIKTSSEIYDEDQVRKADIPSREQAMLSGIVVKDIDQETEVLEPGENLLERASIEPVNATYENGQLTVGKDGGGLDFILDEAGEEWEDLYLSFFLENNDRVAPMMKVKVNEFETIRKSHRSLYRTAENNLTIRVSGADTVSFRIREGSYTLEELELYGESYETLEEAAQKESPETHQTDLSGNRISLQFNNWENDSHLTLPIPYELGWRVKVNGETRDVLETNFAFLGTEIDEGENTVEFVYYPPFFKSTLAIALLSILATVVWNRRLQRNNRHSSASGKTNKWW